MAQSKEKLLKEAEDLKINVEGLDYNQLRTAVKEAKEAADTLNKSESGESPDSDNKVETYASKIVQKTKERQAEAKKIRNKNRKLAEKKKAEISVKEEESKSNQEKASKEKDNRPVFTDDRELKFRFKKTAPESLNIDGKSHKTADIIKNEEIMLELVYGNSNYIEQIH